MARKRLLWHLLPWYLIAAALCLAGLIGYSSRAFTNFYVAQRERDLSSLARVTAFEIADRTRAGEETPETLAGLEALCRDLARGAEARLTVVDPAGRVLCDSKKDPGSLENHGGRPEIREALEGRTGTAVRFSSTLEENLLYVAVPFAYGERRGAVRFAVSVASLRTALGGLRRDLVLGALAALALVVLVSALLARRLAVPLRELRQGAARFAGGEFARPLPVPVFDEFAVVTEEMNRMAAQLDERIRGEVRQRQELEAVLSSMVEGVLAFDREANLISLNEAAAQLLGVRPAQVRGRTIQEAVRNPELQEFVALTLSQAVTQEREISFFDDAGERFIQAHGTGLTDATGNRIGALVVLNDVTSIRRLERMRRDFVANASHEIRTPVTSLKGFIETLQDGAIDDPETARRFLAIMKKNADRLHAIIEDLLNLSRIERETERGEVPLEEAPLRGIVEEALEATDGTLQSNNIRVELDCPPDLRVRAKTSLLVQAIVNLVDNAAKYSEAGSTVVVSCRETERGVAVAVRDSGPGIPREHLPRLFERFYRVDKGRSRSLGGTGLGLAIVKHIVQAHRGEITVESELGKGSTFTILLPKASPLADSPSGASAPLPEP
ncbi:MAG: ATP-binding protein [Candidatus Methylomirabilia bacterium]